jgi:hypothetical protein
MSSTSKRLCHGLYAVPSSILFHSPNETVLSGLLNRFGKCFCVDTDGEDTDVEVSGKEESGGKFVFAIWI